MNDIFAIGISAAFEKIARSTLKPRAIAASIGEGIMTPSLSKKFKVSPGEMRKAQGIAEKTRRKSLRPIKSVDKPTPSQIIAQKRMQYLTGKRPVPRPVTMGGQAGTVVARPSATAHAGARTPPPAPQPDLARRRLFSTPKSMMHSKHAPGSLGAVKHVFAAWRR
jgi:hypothetical protein